MKNKRWLPVVLIFIAIIAVVSYLAVGNGTRVGISRPPTITNFEDCVKYGGAVMESYPPRCSDGRNTFTQEIGNELELSDLITVSNPRPGQKITSPLIFRGNARGNWYFEASFPVKLVNEAGDIIATSHGQAQREWMTEDFVPYEGKLIFTTNAKQGKLILMKDNPSGLPQNDNQLEIPVVFN